MTVGVGLIPLMVDEFVALASGVVVGAVAGGAIRVVGVVWGRLGLIMSSITGYLRRC